MYSGSDTRAAASNSGGSGSVGDSKGPKQSTEDKQVTTASGSASVAGDFSAASYAGGGGGGGREDVKKSEAGAVDLPSAAQMSPQSVEMQQAAGTGASEGPAALAVENSEV